MLSLAPEFLGTMMLTFLGGAIVAVTGDSSIENGSVTIPRALAVALVDGFLFYGLVYITMKLSNQTSGYLNPAFSAGLGVVNMYARANRWHIVRIIAYMVAQIAGAMVGVGMIVAMVPGVLSRPLEKTGAPVLIDENAPWAAFGLTTVLTVFLMFVTLSVRNNEGRMTSLLLCFAYIAARLIVYPLCGGTLNPARALAHATVGGDNKIWSFVWIDISGSMLGAMLASVLYLLWVRKWRE